MQEIALSIIIPYYNETPDELSLILSSLNGQIGVDLGGVECILVNDSNNLIPKELINQFKRLRIKCLHLDAHKGPGVARQAGLDAARGEYVIFCDADDSMYNMTALNAFMEEIEQNRPEVIVSGWMEEHYFANTGHYRYTPRGVDFVWLHGKALNRAFLQNKEIRFHDELRAHEDSYFMGLVYAAAENMRQISAATYVWRARPGSATRADGGAYFFRTIPDFINSTGFLLEAVEARFPQAIRGIVTQSVINVFFTLHTKEWAEKGEQARRESADALFGETIQPYLHYFEEMPDEIISAVYAQQREQLFKDEVESETLRAWLKRITE